MHESISVIIPSRIETDNSKILKSLEGINYPKDKMEIILAIGNCPPAQRNRAAEIAKGDVLYFFNSDSQVEPDIFEKVIDVFNRDENIAGAGGPDLTPKDNNFMQQLFGYAMGSYFAHWKMRARYTEVGKERISDERELLLSNLAIRKDIYLKANGFNNKLYPNEENELINRIIKMGYKFIYSPDIKIYRDRRKSVFEFIRQFYRYGQGRMNQIFVAGIKGNTQFFIPVFFFIYLLSTLFLKKYSISFLPLVAYLTLALIDTLYSIFIKKKNLLLLVPIYILMHISYAMGMIRGLVLQFSYRVPANPSEEILIKHIEYFLC